MAERSRFSGSADDLAAALKPFALGSISFCTYPVEDGNLKKCNALVVGFPHGVQGHHELLKVLYGLSSNLSFGKLILESALEQLAGEVSWKLTQDPILNPWIKAKKVFLDRGGGGGWWWWWWRWCFFPRISWPTSSRRWAQGFATCVMPCRRESPGSPALHGC